MTKILTAEEVAKLLKIDVRTVQRQAKKKFFPAAVCTKFGHQYRFVEEGLMKFLFANDGMIGA